MPTLDHRQLKEILPQTHPFLLIDLVEDYKEGECLTAIKNVTVNEWIFKGRGQPDAPFPETMLIEAAAQAALVLYHVSKVKPGQPRPRYFIGKCDAEFSGPVNYGTTLRLRVTAGKLLDTGGYADVEISADQTEVAKITLFFSVKAQ